MALAALLSFSVLAAWLNASHLMDAILRIQPGTSPFLTVQGMRLLPKGLYGPIIEPITGLIISASLAFLIGFRNLVVTERPWLRMGMFLGLIGVVLACWWTLQLKLDFVNPADASDNEIAEIARTGYLSLRITFARGGESVTASFGTLLAIYSALIAVLAFPESTSHSSERGVRTSLRS